MTGCGAVTEEEPPAPDVVPIGLPPDARPIQAPLDQRLAIEMTGAIDQTAPADGKITSDGQPDAVFDVQLEEPVVALTLLTTDRDGNAIGGQQWDTLVNDDPISVAADARFVKGGWTWQLAVTRPDGQVLNDDRGSLEGTSREVLGKVRIYASSSGYFRPGVYFRLVAKRPDGSSVAGPTYAYSGPSLGAQ